MTKSEFLILDEVLKKLNRQMKANYYSAQMKASHAHYDKSFYTGKSEAFEEAIYMLEEQITHYKDMLEIACDGRIFLDHGRFVTWGNDD